MRILEEETFGPVAPIVGFTDEAETFAPPTPRRTDWRPTSGRATSAAPSGSPKLSTRHCRRQRRPAGHPACAVWRRQELRHRPRGRQVGPRRIPRRQVHLDRPCPSRAGSARQLMHGPRPRDRSRRNCIALDWQRNCSDLWHAHRSTVVAGSRSRHRRRRCSGCSTSQATVEQAGRRRHDGSLGRRVRALQRIRRQGCHPGATPAGEVSWTWPQQDQQYLNPRDVAVSHDCDAIALVGDASYKYVWIVDRTGGSASVKFEATPADVEFDRTGKLVAVVTYAGSMFLYRSTAHCNGNVRARRASCKALSSPTTTNTSGSWTGPAAAW